MVCLADYSVNREWGKVAAFCTPDDATLWASQSVSRLGDHLHLSPPAGWQSMD